MAGLFDDLVPQQQQPVYGPGSNYTGARAPATQAASPYVQSRDVTAPAGSATNPSFDTPDLTGADNSYHVDQQGALHGPAADMNLSMFGDLIPGSGVGGSQISRLAGTPAIKAALAADDGRAPEATDPGSLNVINGFMLGRAPEFDAAGSYMDTALGNAMKRLTGKPVPYGASDAYSATKAADQDRLAAWQAAHPAQGAITSGVGAALNPVNMLAAGALGRAFEGAGATAKLMGFGKAVVGSGALGAGEGAIYGAADPNDPAGSAQRGAIYGGIGGALAVPVGMGLAGVVRGLASAGQRVLSGPIASMGAAMPGITDAQIAAAQAIRTDMAGRGVNVSLPEAVQQVTGGGTGLGRSLRVLEGTKQGQALLGPYFADRPAAVQGAVGNFADTLAPATDQPSMIGVQGQRAAQGALDTVRQDINAEAQPYYEALRDEQFGPVFGRALRSSVPYARALAQIRGSAELNAPIAHLPDDNLSVVNEVVKQLDRNIQASQQTALNPRGNNQIAGLRTAARGRADTLASLVSDNWRNARSTIEQGRAARLAPLEAGPLGAIARSEEVGAQTGALYPANPLAGAPSETTAAILGLNSQDPTVAGALSRQHILQSLNGSRPMIQSGANPYVGSNFANRVAGNPEQQATLLAGVREAAPGGEEVSADLGRLLEGLRATGMREPAGSKTAFNAEDMQQLHATKVGKVLRRGGDPLEWGAGIADWLDSQNYRRNVEGLAAQYTAAPDQTAAVLDAARGAAPPVVPLRLPALPYQVTGVPAMAYSNNRSAQ